MAKNTSNYNLKKPTPEDFYNVEDQNGNMDIIDQELRRLNEDNQNADQKISSVKSDLSSHLSDYVRQPGYAISTGVANTYLATLNPAPATFGEGLGIVLKIHAANTGPSTLNVNGIGAKPIIDSKGYEIKAGKLLYGRIYSLKYDGANFQLQGEGGEIPKLPNLIKNGNFEKGAGVNCWAFAGSTISASGNIMTYIANGRYGRVYQNVPKPAINDKIYIRCDLKGATTARFIFYYDSSSLLGFDISPSVANTWQTLSSIFVCPSNTSSGNISFDDVAASGWQPIQVRNVMFFNLTQMFGPGNEPTKEEVDAMVFSSTNIVRNGNCEEGITGWTIMNDSNPLLSVVGNKFRIVTSTLSIMCQNVNVKPNTNYHISGTVVVVSGANGAYIRPYTLDGSALINNTGVFNTGSNSVIRVGMLIAGAGTADFDSIMLVEGTTAPSSYKSYMPYGWWDSDLPLLTSDADAVSGDILSSKVAYANGLRLAGTMPIRGSEEYAGWRRATVEQPSMSGRVHLAIPKGAYLGEGNNGQVGVFCDDPNFLPANIISGKSIFGLIGSYLGKSWYKGTGISLAYTTNYMIGNGVIGLVYGLKVQVNLNFSPKTVLIWRNADGRLWTIVSLEMPTPPGWAYPQIIEPSQGNGYLLDGTYAYISNSGFSLPVPVKNEEYTFLILG